MEWAKATQVGVDPGMCHAERTDSSLPSSRYFLSVPSLTIYNIFDGPVHLVLYNFAHVFCVFSNIKYTLNTNHKLTTLC